MNKEKLCEMLAKEREDATENELRKLGFVEDSCGTDTDTPGGCNDYYMKHPMFDDEDVLEEFGEIVLMFTVEDRLELEDEVVRVEDAENIEGYWQIWTN